MADNVINHVYIMKPPKKSPKEGLESFWVGEQSRCREVVPGESKEREKQFSFH